MTKGNRIKFKKDVTLQGVKVRKGQEWEMMMASSEESNNNIFVKVGKKGKALSPYGNGNMFGVSTKNLNTLVEKGAVAL